MKPARHMAIVGPTACGKSALAIELARQVEGIEIVSVDSMQVYKGMDIGTAKPSDEQRAEVPHHLIDLVEPTEDFSVLQFQEQAETVIAEIENRGHTALLVGGTGLYIRAIVDHLEIPGQFPDVRAELETQDDTAVLHDRLQELDPIAAGRITETNRRRIIRALEVTLGSGRPFSSFGSGLTEYQPSRFSLIGIWLPRDVVNSRIEARYSRQMEDGMLEEVQSLVNQPLSRTAKQALGYRELISHLQDRVALADALEEAVRRTKAFARRQRMWFRRDPRITWLGTPDRPVALLPVLLENWSRWTH